MDSFLSGVSPDHKFWLGVIIIIAITALAVTAMITKTSVEFLGAKLNSNNSKEKLKNENND